MLLSSSLPTALVAVLLALSTCVSAVKQTHPEIREKHDIKIDYKFPDNELLIFPSGKTGKVKFTLTNLSKEKITVFKVTTTYTKPKDFTKKVSLSPSMDLSFTLVPNKPITYNHVFATDIEAQKANLQIAFDCDDFHGSDDPYRIIAMNTPVEVIFSDSLFDLKSTTLFGLVSYLFYTVFFYKDTSKIVKTKKPRPAPSPSQSKSDLSTELDPEWISGHTLQKDTKVSTPKIKKRK
ncbi:hypothetical protein BDEG_26198 [Batrachochytrium dendrobatidis JEL423]|uniref:Signal sequence receptor subunit alpha n=1 Tax=Batrachochytrium dendrobatidis (strain JEL423) TaxID=403673 RepID=A0A177WSK6_BATDL|nr:hypothetical protein BDEG_26198 [Batrachochytrium dendrobatidis JEL423]